MELAAAQRRQMVVVGKWNVAAFVHSHFLLQRNFFRASSQFVFFLRVYLYSSPVAILLSEE